MSSKEISQKFLAKNPPEASTIKFESASGDCAELTESGEPAIIVTVSEPDGEPECQRVDEQRGQRETSSCSDGDNGVDSKKLVESPSSGAVDTRGNGYYRLLETLDRYILTPAIGPKQAKVCWVSTNTEHSRFVERFGPMFEDYRGHVVMKRDSHRRGVIDKKKETLSLLDPLHEKPLFTVKTSIRRRGPPKKIPFYRHSFQTCMGVLLLSKLVFLGVLVKADDDNESLPQLLILLCTSIVVLGLLRFTQPYIRRLDLALALLAEVADITVFTLAIVLLTSTGEEQSVRRNIGISMIVLEGGTMVLIFIEKASMLCGHFSSVRNTVRSYLQKKKDKSINEAVDEESKTVEDNEYEELDAEAKRAT